LNDLLRKSPVEFSDGEIQKIQRVTTGRKNYLIYFSRANISGYFISTNLPESLQSRPVEQITMQAHSKALFGQMRSHIFQFYKNSATFSWCVFTIVFAFIFPYLKQAIIHFANPSQYVTSICDIHCVIKNANIYFVLLMTSVTLVTPFFFSWLFYFKMAERNKNSNARRTIKMEALVFGLVSLFMLFGFVQELGKHDLGKLADFKAVLQHPQPENPQRSTSSENPHH
jgi:hypothetical protein